MKKVVLLLLFLSYYFPLLAQKQVDSLLNIIRTHSQTDTSHILAVIKLADLYVYNKPDTSLILASQALEISQKINFSKGVGRASQLIGIYHRREGNIAVAIKFLELSVSSCKQINDVEGVGLAYNNIAALYRKEANYSLAMEYCLKALNIFDLAKYEKGKSYVLHQLGVIASEQGNYEQAMNYFQKSLLIGQKRNDTLHISFCYHTIGKIYGLQNNHEKSLEYQLKNLELSQKLKNKVNTIYAWNNIGLSYIALKKYDLVLPYLQKGLKVATEINNITLIANINLSLARYYNLTNQNQEALKYSKIALELANKIKDFRQISDAAFEYSEAMAKNGNYQEALTAHKLHKKMEDTLSSQESQRKVMAKEYAYKDEKKKIEQEQKDIAYQIEIEKQNFYRYLLIIGLGIVLIIIFLVIRNNYQKNKANNLLRQKNDEINLKSIEINTKSNEIQATLKLVEKQKHEIQHKNENITASIIYAQRIQQSMLPFEGKISNGLNKNNYFILYKPRDIVSGDFYFYEEVKNKIIIAVGDCTGHGVPGAFMSMIGNQILTEIVVKNRLLSPEKILNILHYDIRRTLKQSVNIDSGDGMDIAIIALTKNNKVENISSNAEKTHNFTVLEYAGAMNPLFVVQNNEIVELKADKKSIGGQAYKGETERIFSKQTIDLMQASDTMIYLVTDGYQDQFGGEKGKKFMTKRFRELLFSIHNETMTKQKEILDHTIIKWIADGNETQTDDITVLGFKV